ncbi:rhamnose-binding lectin-like isoform X3 [Rhodnius prolixus]|uniref:rhamnose-binding lectin-like isoform X3 n=1 Tax=Rhodnius prolixus TaxID=13249 RepID=UPI003D188453
MRKMFYIKLFLFSVFLSIIIAVTGGEPMKTLGCENDSVYLSCPKGYAVDVLSALYGKKDRRICHHPGNDNANCAAGNALTITKFKCNGKQNCVIEASNRVFGDPCWGTIKYLEVTYDCKKVIISTTTACEHKTLKISCPHGSYLWIVNALYGRVNPLTCFEEGQKTATTNCDASTAMGVLESRCNNLRECTIVAENSVFGDPCFGIFKYLEVDYECRNSISGEQKSSVACEHDKLTISCNDGYYIRIVNALYGRKQQSTCFRAGLVSNTNCAAGSALTVVQSRCDNLSKCTVDASNEVFGDPCFGTFKYLEVEYECVPSTKPSSVACEHQKLNISCNDGHYLWIVNALYGRKQSCICPMRNRVSNTNCSAGTALSVVQSRCNNLTNCSVDASSRMFGDPCIGTYKYLEVEYQCLPISGSKTSSVACEHDKLNIKCNPGYSLWIVNALYGRKQQSTCFRAGQVSNTNCAAGTALTVVQSRCNKLTECTVDASNGMFGDPCFGTYKYLEVEYQCLPNKQDVLLPIDIRMCNNCI